MSAPSAALSPVALRFLATPGRYAVIATLGADGTPHQVVVWYRLDDDGLLINSLVGRRWSRELLADRRIAFAVHESDATSHREDYVAVQAEVVVAATGPEALGDIEDLARRYGDDPTGFEGQARISFRLVPRAVSVHGTLE